MRTIVNVKTGDVILDEHWVSPDLPVEPEPTDDDLWGTLRAQRDTRLATTDWLVQRHAEELALGLDTTLTPGQHTDLLTYRQALRDLPANTTDPANPEWPNYEP